MLNSHKVLTRSLPMTMIKKVQQLKSSKSIRALMVMNRTTSLTTPNSKVAHHKTAATSPTKLAKRNHIQKY